MTEGSKIGTIEYRLDRIDNSLDTLVESNKDLWKLMAEQRAQKEATKGVQSTLESVNATLDTIWRKHDEVADIVKPKHESWTEAAKNQKKFMLAIVLMFLASVGAMVGLG